MRKPSVLVLVGFLAAATAAVAVAGRRADLRLLERLRHVDGAGSGLDADTVRGLSPDQMKGDVTDDTIAHINQRLDALEATAGAGALRSLLYAHANRATLSPGESQHLYADCNTPKDLALSCAGGAFAGAADSPVTWMGVVQGDGSTTVDRCLVVVQAGSSAPSTQIEANVRCLQLP